MLGLRSAGEQLRSHYGARRAHNVAHRTQPGIRCISFENYTLDELIAHLERFKGNGGLRELLQRYSPQRSFPNMSHFRLGPNMFGKAALDWIAFTSDDGALVAHGITTRIRWAGETASLPRGWTGCVRLSYEQSVLHDEQPNTLVGLFIFAETAFREHGWAGEVAEEMKRLAREAALESLIIPLRLPTRYEWQNARAPYEEFAFQRRDDGQYRDHWLRLHVRLGADVLGTSKASHQHAMHPDDLCDQLRLPRFERSGEHVVKWNDEYYTAIVDLEREFAVINEGCVWVRHSL